MYVSFCREFVKSLKVKNIAIIDRNIKVLFLVSRSTYNAEDKVQVTHTIYIWNITLYASAASCKLGVACETGCRQNQ